MRRISSAFSFLLIGTIAMSSCGSNSNSVQGEDTKDESGLEYNGPYKISGHVDSVKIEGNIIVTQYNPNTQKHIGLDTAVIDSEGNYELVYHFEQPTLLRVNFFRKQKIMLVIDKGQHDIKLNVEGIRDGKVKVDGSKDSELLIGYEAFRNESFDRLVDPTYDAMDVAEEDGDLQGEIDAVEAYALKNEEHRTELITYAKENIGTSLALYGTMLRWTGDDNVIPLEELVVDFENAHPDLYMAKEMREKLERFKKVALGITAPEIELKDTDGNTHKLSETNAKYVLIDFWASWCGPCILQTPDLREAHKNFKDKGFEIYSVSLDDDKKSWDKAVDKLELQNWINVSDLQGWASDAGKDYNVSFVPYNFLIDLTQDRKIIAKNLHSKSLQGKLEELLRK